ncbi:hypothetical protein GCM10023189_01890 [Nibrella saemangeumensis]|uniref:Plasmid stabilization system protein ParE n=1 Tax=Nibrella saemangeumensis TaxID=1084526 RepID=A0ABP8M911_9BACT
MAKIIWTREATRELQALVTYLRSNWSKAVAEEFIGTLDDKLKLLQEIPDTGVASYEYDTVRRLLIARNRVLYYQTAGDAIYILNVFDLLSDQEENPYFDS